MNIKKNIIANYIGRFYTMVIGIVVLPIYLKYLGAEAYGLVGFFTMFISWMMLLDMGFSQVLSRETAILKDKIDGLSELKLILRGVETMILVVSIFVAIIVLLSSDWIVNSWLNVKELPFETVKTSIEIMGFMFILKWFVSLYDSLLVGFEEQVWLNIYKIIISSIRFIGGLILIIYITNDILYYFLYQASIAIIEFILLNRKVYSNLPQTNFIFPSIKYIKKIAPFALGIAYTSGIWIVYTQLDKLLLSHYIPLAEYGYFTLVVLVSNAIMQFSSPLSQAILPRMTSLLSNGEDKKMLSLYRKGTRFISAVIFSVVGIVIFYSYELLYAWTGDTQASLWSSKILIWYALGNAILSISAFQYYLQFAYGNLKYHIQFNTYFPFIALPIVFYAVTFYGALGAGLAWFLIQAVTFLIWPPFVHSKFAKGIHFSWIFKDILPSLIITIGYLWILDLINIDFALFNRLETFIILIILGGLLLVLNLLILFEFNKKNKLSIISRLGV